MKLMLASDFRQAAAGARVTVRKGLRNAIRSNTPTARAFVTIQGTLHRNATRAMVTEARFSVSSLNADMQLLESYLTSCSLKFQYEGSELKVWA